MTPLEEEFDTYYFIVKWSPAFAMLFFFAWICSFMCRCDFSLSDLFLEHYLPRFLISD